MTPKGQPIVVFFTHGVSLALWEAQGMFSREVRFYQALAEKAGPVWFFTYGRDDAHYLDRLGPHIRLFPKRLAIPNLLYGFLLPFLHWREIKKARLIRIHQMAGAIPALLAHWVFRKPLLVRCGYQWSAFLEKQCASTLKQWVASWIERMTYRHASQMIVTTQEDAKRISSRYGIKPECILVISNYIDTELFKPLSVEKYRGRVCAVGRLVEQKNFVNLVKAAVDLPIELVIYGDGPLREKLEQTAREHRVNLSLPGRIANTELPQKLNECELFVLPSLYEGNPKVLLEAMSCGIPVIGTRVEGIDSVITHNKNGILCDTDSASLRVALQSLLNDSQKQAELGKQAREYILSTCSLTHAITTEIHSYASPRLSKIS